jgi:hypothetical protein
MAEGPLSGRHIGGVDGAIDELVVVGREESLNRLPVMSAVVVSKDNSGAGVCKCRKELVEQQKKSEENRRRKSWV